MKKSKLIDILETFSVAELRQFRDFVASPFYNKKEELITMIDFLIEQAPHFPKKSIKKEQVYRMMYSKQPYDDKQMRYLMSYLTKLAEQFLIVSRYEEQAGQCQLDLMQSFLDRKLEKYYAQQRRKTKQFLTKQAQKDSSSFYQNYIFSDLGDQHFSQLRVRRFDPNIQYASEYLDRFYYLKKLKYTCGMLDRQSILQGAYDIHFSQELMQHLQNKKFFDEPILELYYTILQSLMDGDNDAHFQRLKNLIAHASNQVTLHDLREIYSFGINYCARMIRKGKEAYVQEALQLYLDGIRKEILIQDGHLSPWTFTNVVKLALRLQQYDWIEGFIREYAPKLPESFRENALHYNLAELYYYTRAYDDAQDHLNQVQLSDLNYHVGARVILAKIYYETDEENALLSLLAAFTVFLKRNKKISNDLKKTYLNFCHFLFQLVRRKKKQLPKLRRQINETKFLTDRAWLLQMIDDVEKR